MIAHRFSASALRRRQGFTLLEVLATLVVISIVMPIVMKGISLALSAASLSKRSVEAATLAESKLEELAVVGPWSTGTMSGDFGADWPDYRWNTLITSRDTDLMEISVNVTWPWRGGERSVGLSTMVYVPMTGTTGSTNSQGTGSTGQ
ncbi:MAG: type IV pilus modification PilV family protein [Bacillota bacterium]